VSLGGARRLAVSITGQIWPPAAPAADEAIFLRLLEPEDGDLIQAEQTPQLDEFNWFLPRRPGVLRRRIEAGTDIDDDGGSAAVSDATGKLLGDISWRRCRSSPAPASFYWELGIFLLSAARGRGIGTAAQRLLPDYLFATTLANRVQATTDIENVAEHRSLEKAGFTREGVLRGFQYRRGAWHDLVMFSKLRGEE
jgi:RimJ/RimL family protein N-acetyltransferase